MTARRDFVSNLYTSRKRLYDALPPKEKKGMCCPNTSPYLIEFNETNCGENEIRTRDTLGVYTLSRRASSTTRAPLQM